MYIIIVCNNFVFQLLRADSKHVVRFSNHKCPGCPDSVEFVEMRQNFQKIKQMSDETPGATEELNSSTETPLASRIFIFYRLYIYIYI